MDLSIYGFSFWVHIISIAIYAIVLSFRLFLLFSGREEDLLLFQERSRILNITILTIVLVTGVHLGFNYDFTYGRWFVFKLLMLAATAFIGDYAFKNYNKLAGVATLILFLYIILLSYTKNISIFIE